MPNYTRYVPTLGIIIIIVLPNILYETRVNNEKTRIPYKVLNNEI